MLARHMAGYAPALVVTGLMSFASVTIFTNLLSQAEYGQYALAVNAMAMIVGVCFFWLQSATSRLMPQAVEQGKEKLFASTLYCTFIFCSLFLLIIVGCIALGSNSLGDWWLAAWFAVPLAVLRALLNINQAIHRNFFRIKRYNMIEAGQAVFGLLCSILLILFLHQRASGAAIGAMAGLLMMSLFDWRMLGQAQLRNFDLKILKEIIHFGAPFVVTFGFSFVLSGSDRFLIEYFLGPDQVGIYSASYAFPDRICQSLFMVVATASFPLTVRLLEKEGPAAARQQTYTNGSALLALAVPACIGLLLVNRQIVATLIGADFREGAIRIMPWIAVATVLNGIAAHHFDHAFHLAKKTRLFFYTLGPAALLNFIGNLYAIPHFGVIGAAYTTLAAYALYLFLSVFLGRRVFKVQFPFIPAIQIGISAGLMAIALSVFNFPENWAGLIMMIALGGSVYGISCFVFNVMGIRSFVKERLLQPKSLSSKVSISSKGPAPKFEILRNFHQVEALANEWRALFDRNNKTLFGSYEWFQIWWKHLGHLTAARLHIVVARDDKGLLIALAPLAIRKDRGLRILEWAGYDVFDFGDFLITQDAEAKDLLAKDLWQFVERSGGYDISLIKDVRDIALSYSPLREHMILREQNKNYFLTLSAPSGEAWLAEQSRKLRGDIRRKTEKMQAQGVVGFQIYQYEDELPLAVINALYDQKAAWAAARSLSGIFDYPQSREFIIDLAKAAAQEKTLYLAWISCGEAIVACHMGFIEEGVLHLYLTTYDAGYAAYSPGNSLMCETIMASIDAGLRELDFMRGEEDYKQRFASGIRPLSAFVSSGSLVGKILLKLRTKKTALNTP